MFSKRKKLVRRQKIFYVFVALSNVWLNKRKLGSHMCFCSFCCLCCFGWKYNQPICVMQTLQHPRNLREHLLGRTTKCKKGDRIVYILQILRVFKSRMKYYLKLSYQLTRERAKETLICLLNLSHMNYKNSRKERKS